MVDGIGAITYQKLVAHFGNTEKIFSASKKELMEVDGMREKTANSIKSFRLEEEIKSELNQIDRYGVNILTINESKYPSNLKTIYDPPHVLYVKGQVIGNDAISLAVVGSRAPTTYGKLITEKICKKLGEAGMTIISGMARGIDSIAHKSAIAGGGRTIAVLGCGLSVTYPPENFKLMNDIINQGAVISEFSMSTNPDKMNFPQRNRIISGLSLGTLIVEAAEKSGSLITARHAVEQGREVFAVPGSINSPKSKGTNRLIKSGAKLVDNVEDIIDELPSEVRSFLRPVKKENEESYNLMGDERHIFSLISTDSQHIDTIIEHSNLPANIVSGILTKLELNGIIRQISGKMFIRS